MGMINEKWLISDKRANMDKKITRAKRVNLLREESEDFKKNEHLGRNFEYQARLEMQDR